MSKTSRQIAATVVSGPTLAPAAHDAVQAVLARMQSLPGALLPILHAIQDALGHVPEAAVPLIAQALNLSRAEVHGVISFYHDFRAAPAGRHTIKLCRAEACQAMGAVALAKHVQQRLGIGFQETSADGSVTLDAVYCLGNCACSPAALIDGELHGRVTPAMFDALIDALETSP